MKLYLVVPCYNEEAMLGIASTAMKDKMLRLMKDGKISSDSKILFVDDGSKDRTWQIITELHRQDPIFDGVKLSRNRGHQNALLAGLMTAKERCDAAVSLDCDLQDDIEVIDQMIEKYKAGCDVVYGVRSSRKKDSFFKRNTALFFYRLMRMMGTEAVYNHADYRLMSKRALNALEQFSEVNLFLRGLVPLIGYQSGTVEYERKERTAGESKYPLKKMVIFAVEGITSMSVSPIRLITAAGFIVFAVSVILLIYSLIVHLLGETVQGWTSLAVSIWAIGGLQLLAIGIIGEYIGKIYMEVKKRPKFIIEEHLDESDKDDPRN